jgi:hypothetical protein
MIQSNFHDKHSIPLYNKQDLKQVSKDSSDSDTDSGSKHDEGSLFLQAEKSFIQCSMNFGDINCRRKSKKMEKA